MTTIYLATDISWDEAPGGVAVLHAYGDPLTKAEPWTIGFGSTGADIRKDTVWTAQYAAERRDMMILDVIDHLKDKLSFWSTINDERQDVLVNMGYQMGWQGLLKFTSTLAAEALGKWETVAADMHDSLWDQQTPKRADRLIEQARTGVRLPRTYDHLVAGAPRTNEAQPVPALVPAQPKENTLMSKLTQLFHFIFDPLTANAARASTSSNTATSTVGNAVLTAATTAIAGTGAIADSSNSAAGGASDVIKELEDDLNAVILKFSTATIDQLPVVGAIAEATGLDKKVAGAGVALLALGEQHALTYVAGLFQAHKANVVAQIVAS